LRLRRWSFNHRTSIESSKVTLLQISVALLTVMPNSVRSYNTSGVEWQNPPLPLFCAMACSLIIWPRPNGGSLRKAALTNLFDKDAIILRSA
jgi:hypothetical protein